MTMYHETLPDESGYYWIDVGVTHDNDVEGALAYLAVGDEPALIVFRPDRINIQWVRPRDMVVWRDRSRCDGYWVGPTRWIGPLPSPFGLAGSECAYFAHGDYACARGENYALTMKCVEWPNGRRILEVDMPPAEEREEPKAQP